MNIQFNGFTRFNLLAGQYILYVYLVVLTVIVIHQITKLKESDTKTKALVEQVQKAQSTIDAAHKHMEHMIKQEDAQQKQLLVMLEILKHEQKESKHIEKLFERSR